MEILHSGQTGVERGAHRAARALGIRVGGVCVATQRDELGDLPRDIASALTPSPRQGARNALHGTLALATAVLVVVPDRDALVDAAGMIAIARAARARGLPCEIADPSTPTDALIHWVSSVQPSADLVRLMVTGPRGTRWPQGDRVGWQIVTALATAASADRDVVIPASRVRSPDGAL